MHASRALVLMAMAGTAVGAMAQDRVIEFPDVSGYHTLIVDPHTHSVFSDGLVWPSIRIDESKLDGLDLVAVTEHLEYQPHSEDIPHPDRNRSFVLATDHAERAGSELIVVNGAEITREPPLGHVNAVFLIDANALRADNPMSVFRAANRQGAFLFWNHPWSYGLRSDGVAALTDMHRSLIADGLLHGIEVANGNSYSSDALQIALDHDLTILGVSDIHGLIDWDYDIHGGGHRTVTLVFAVSRTAEAIREALLARRTVAWMNNTLIGRDEVLMPLIEASLTVTEVVKRGQRDIVDVTLSNASDATFELANRGDHRFQDQASLIRVPAHGDVTLIVAGEPRSAFALELQVMNAITAPGSHPMLSLDVRVR